MPYLHLNGSDRSVIHHLVLCGLSLREIGRRLGRSHTTISRELKRNAAGKAYCPALAHRLACKRLHWPRPGARRGYGRLYRYVVRRLRTDWSPEQVAGRLRMDYPGDERMRVSAETIYQWIYRNSRQGGTLHLCLRRRRRYRRNKQRCPFGLGFIVGRVGISERPAIVATRSRFGDWEGDTLQGAHSKGAISSIVERKSRYLLAAPLTDKSADATRSQVVNGLRRIPRCARKTLTVDNGVEFAQFGIIEKQTGIAVFFADPYAAWQRGTNENTNGLLRQYFPKGADLRSVSRRDLARVVKKLNHRPRKCLGYSSPHEVFRAEIRGALKT